MNGAWVSAFGRADAVLMAEAWGRVVYGVPPHLRWGSG